MRWKDMHSVVTNNVKAGRESICGRPGCCLCATRLIVTALGSARSELPRLVGWNTAMTESERSWA